jgi:hypothetical protein
VHRLGVDAGADASEHVVAHRLAVGLAAHAVEVVEEVEQDRGVAAVLGTPQLRNWSMAANIMDSQTGPQPMDASPMLATTMPGWWLIRLYRAAPCAIGAEPPTMALLGIEPNGVKNACIEPPMPRLKPVLRAKISASVPNRMKFSASSASVPCGIFSA